MIRRTTTKENDHYILDTLSGINKLGELEDFEQSLNMSLLVFFESLKATKVYVAQFDDYLETDLYYLNGDDPSKWSFDVDGHDTVTLLFFRDYGITWALTKEGLLRYATQKIN